MEMWPDENDASKALRIKFVMAVLCIVVIGGFVVKCAT